MHPWLVTFAYQGYGGMVQEGLEVEARTPGMALRKALTATSTRVRGALVSVQIDPLPERQEAEG